MWWIPVANAQSFMPPAVTEIAGQVDSIYEFLLVTSLISFVILIGGMTYFVFKFRRKSDSDKTAYITHNHTLEFIWSFIPLVIFLVCCFWGVFVYMDMRTVPEGSDPIEIHVVGKKWLWEFTYKNGHVARAGIENGKQVPPTLVVPENKDVKLIMTSTKVDPNNKRDHAVLHSFFVPAMRIKQDLVPGKYTMLWFNAQKKGMFQVFCTEYCGTGHSSMLARIHVVSQLEYDNFILGDSSGGPKELTMAQKGEKLFVERACAGCHSLDGSKMTGPTWKGLWGSERQFNDGPPVLADENYIRESIMYPNKKIAKGYVGNQMPAYGGQLKDEDIAAIIEFMKQYK